MVRRNCIVPTSFLGAPVGASRPELCAPTILEVCGLDHGNIMPRGVGIVKGGWH